MPPSEGSVPPSSDEGDGSVARPSWTRLEPLLDELLELPAGERASRLAELAAGDDELKAAAARLLAVDPDGLASRDAAALLALLETAVEPWSDRVGERLGPFRITSELGRGGMGAVYGAERVDGGFEQRVAIKVLRRGLDSEDLLARFLAERRILARLEHPRIARLIDGGLTSDGVPWFAMERVDGRPITVEAERRALPVRERLEWFLAVCEAVAFAHRQLVVHRDLKPSNVLVDDAGQVKLLDFGIAKVLEPGQPGLTRTTGAPMTPQYAAPEQLAGGEVSTATDVWQLGRMLGELVAAGRSRDLARIVAVACHEQPERRYRSVEALGEDVRRFLDGQPVTARDDSAIYRLWRLVVRQRRAAASVATALVLGGVVVVIADRLAKPAAVGLPALRFQLVSTFPGSHRQASFSPDGKRIAFVMEDSAGTPQVWLKKLQGGEPVQLTREASGVDRPRWHPREDRIFFGVHGGGIWSVASSGGSPVLVVEHGQKPNLSRDGRWLVFEHEQRIRLARLAGAGSAVTSMSAGAPPRSGIPLFPAQPAFSSDGGSIAFVQYPNSPLDGDLWIWRRDGSPARQLTFDDSPIRSPVFAPDGSAIYASSSRGGGLTLWRFPVRGGAPQQVTTGAGEDVDADISADGRRLIYTNQRNSQRLVWLDPRTGEQRVLVERRLTTTHPSFSPSGEEVVFFGRESDGRSTHLFTVGTDGKHLRQLTTEDQVVQSLPDWSADGKWIHYYHFDRPRRLAELRRLPLAGGPAQSLVTDWRFPQAHGSQVDPAGRFVVYTRLGPTVDSRATGAGARTLVRDLASGAERALPLMWWPRWSPDGAWIAGGDTGGSVVICRADGSTCRRVARGREPRWDARGEVYFRAGPLYGDIFGTRQQPSVELRAVKLDGSGERHVADLTGPHRAEFFYDVSRNGEIVWSSFAEGQHELWMADLPAAR
jgi:Tol biopolymer transport system component